MKSLNKTFVLFFLFSLFFPATIMSQNFEDFQKSVLIDIPGDNYDFDLLSSGKPYPFYNFYITWVNNNNSIYTIYLKKVTPETIDTNIVISSDSVIKSNPQIAYNSIGQDMTIMWENFSEPFYRIVGRDYSDTSLSNEIVYRDSLSDDPQITMNYNHIAWIMDGDLYFEELHPNVSGAIMIDTFCTSPSIVTDETWSGEPAFIYEKFFGSDHRIYIAEYINFPNPYWVYSEIADGDNRKPEFGAGDGISFESVAGSITKIKYYPYFAPEPDLLITQNTGCNYKNPDVFSYPQVTDQQDTPFFVVFDTDSLENNNEVMLQAFYYGDQFINLSDMEGDDYKPKADLMLYNDIAYVAIVWEHQDGIHSTIWMAKTLYFPAGGVKQEGNDPGSFELLQNYPNPFNPATTIEFTLKLGSDVRVTVFDILGNRIATLVDGYEYAGSHKVIFDGKNLSSGIYFYSIEVNNLQQTKAMILLR